MRPSVENQVEAVRRAGRALEDPANGTRVREALEAKHALVVQSAARILADAPQGTLAPHLDGIVEALGVWLEDSRRRDAGCGAKTALVQALVRGEAARVHGVTPGRARELLRLAARTIQWEKVYGGRVDVAGDLRIAAGAGLVTVGDPQALPVLADHLADPLGPVRGRAAANLAAHGGTEAALLLRLRARIGDQDPAVLGDVLRALLALVPSATEVVAAWLDREDHPEGDACFAEAAFALGATRAEAGLAALLQAWEAHVDTERRRVLLTALGEHRSEASIAFLVDVARDAGPELADAARALLPPERAPPRDGA